MNDAPSITDANLPPELLEALRTIAEPSRARVIEFLGHGEHCVCDLGSALGLSPALASHHLKVLKSSGLIRERRAGRWVYYSLDLDRVAQLRLWIDRLLTPTLDAAQGVASSHCAVDPTPIGQGSSRQQDSAQPAVTR
jgi:ArsR family transcriptional regulator